MKAHTLHPNGWSDWMKHYRSLAHACIALACIVISGALAACGGSSGPSVSAPEEPLKFDFIPEHVREYQLPFRISGVTPPLATSIDGCPDWVRLLPDQGILVGLAPTEDRGRTFLCTYSITRFGGRIESYGLRLTVDPLDRGPWRFRTRTVQPGGPCAPRSAGTRTPVAILPHAQGEEVDQAAYQLIDFPNDRILSFDEGTRQLTYTHPSADPIVGTPNTYRYLVGNAGVDATNASDALCLDIQYNPGPSASCPADPDASPPLKADYFIHIQLQVRDDAFWDENAGEAGEYRCPDSTAPAPRSAAQSNSISNPVHTALAPVHARRAVDIAHATIRDRVHSWSPEDPRQLAAISPAIGLATLSGQSDGFDYTGSSESLSAGAELGAGSWQAGLVASFARTDLHYRAQADLSERGYLAGEHDTGILSLHPFAAWHASSGGHFWASLGAGMGELRHRDDLGFPSWSRSDVSLLAYDVGASVPVADVLSGELQAEAGIESFALEIEGGGDISSSLPTMRGLDYRAGVTWSAPVPGEPSVSLAYKHLTGDGPEGGALEARGSLSVAEFFDPRISVTGSAEASLSLGDYDRNLWGLGVGFRFARDGLRRGFGLDLDTHLTSPANEQSSDVSIRGEAGYGLWVGPLFGIVRPYVGLISYQGQNAVRQTLGLDIRDAQNPQMKVELYDHPSDRYRALHLLFRHHW